MPAELIDGRALARRVLADVARRVEKLALKGVKPGLGVVLVGDDPASAVYVGGKIKACEEAGMHSVTLRLPADTSESDLLARVGHMNADPAIHGILVQMPLPKQINAEAVIRRVDPSKDVDGFHPVNVGKMLVGDLDGFVPCTPLGIQLLLQESGVKTPGKHCVIIGRSNIVGKPMAALLMQDNDKANCTVTVCHRHTVDLRIHTREAHILNAARIPAIRKSLNVLDALEWETGDPDAMRAAAVEYNRLITLVRKAPKMGYAMTNGNGDFEIMVNQTDSVLVFGEAKWPGEPFYYSSKVVGSIGQEEVRVVLLMCNQQLL